VIVRVAQRCQCDMRFGNRLVQCQRSSHRFSGPRGLLLHWALQVERQIRVGGRQRQ
jgi:hypothetical protein